MKVLRAVSSATTSNFRAPLLFPRRAASRVFFDIVIAFTVPRSIPSHISGSRERERGRNFQEKLSRESPWSFFYSESLWLGETRQVYVTCYRCYFRLDTFGIFHFFWYLPLVDVIVTYFIFTLFFLFFAILTFVGVVCSTIEWNKMEENYNLKNREMFVGNFSVNLIPLLVNISYDTIDFLRDNMIHQIHYMWRNLNKRIMWKKVLRAFSVERLKSLDFIVFIISNIFIKSFKYKLKIL